MRKTIYFHMEISYNYHRKYVRKGDFANEQTATSIYFAGHGYDRTFN